MLKTLIPNSTYDFGAFKFFDSGDGCFLLSPEMYKLRMERAEDFKKYKIFYRKDIMHFGALKPFCMNCLSRDFIKYGFTKRKLIFEEGGATGVRVQRYKCKKCGKTFQTDLSLIVKPNCNFTNNIREKTDYLMGSYLTSLNNTSDIFKVFSGVDISHQTIQNFLISEEKTPIISKNFHTGFYIFDVEHVKISGKWKYFFLIIDAVSSRIINYQLYDKENKKNLKDFLDESVPYHLRNTITTDLAPMYRPVIKELQFQNHQWCNFHMYKEAYRRIYKYTKGLKNKKKLRKESKEEFKQICEIFKETNYWKIKDHFSLLRYRKAEFNKITGKLIDWIASVYKNFILYNENNKIERTSNKIENCFQKIMPRFKKKIYKTETGFLTRIKRKIIKWNLKHS